jgi:hypothetical protein
MTLFPCSPQKFHHVPLVPPTYMFHCSLIFMTCSHCKHTLFHITHQFI